MAPHIHRNLYGGRKQAARTLFFLVTVIFVTALVAYAQQDVGFVVNFNGKWFINSSRQANSGSPLHAGDTIRARNPGAGDFIEIANLSGRIIKKFNCAEDDCNRPIILEAAQSGIVSRWFRAVMTILNRDPKSHKVVISRGGSDLREAVVKIAGGRVELSSVLANLRAGSYLLRFESKRSGAKPIGPIRVEWDPKKPSPVTVTGLAPGLYVVLLLNYQDREPGEPGTEAWVLFAKPDRFDKVSGEFREAVDLTDQWGNSVRVSSKRQLLRVTLTNLEAEAR